MIRLFNEKSISAIFNLTIQNIPNKINVIDYQVLNVDLHELAQNTANQNKLKKLEIDFDKRDVDVVIVDLAGSRFPAGIDVQGHKSYPCAVVKYTFTIEYGHAEFLGVRPKSANFNHDVGIEVYNNKFTISYQTRYANKDLSDAVKKEVKQNMKAIITSCKEIVTVINQEIDEFNDSLHEYYYQILEAKKIALQKEIDLKNDLNNI